MRHARFTAVNDEDARWVEKLPANEWWQVWSVVDRKLLGEFGDQADAWAYVLREQPAVGPMFLLPPKP